MKRTFDHSAPATAESLPNPASSNASVSDAHVATVLFASPASKVNRSTRCSALSKAARTRDP